MIRILIILCITFWLCSCSSDSEQISRIANITKDIQVNIPAPVFTEESENKILLTTSYNNDKRKLIVISKIEKDSITLTGLTTSYINLFTLKYTKNNLSLLTSLPKSMLPPVNQVLLDIMLCHSNNLNNELTDSFIVEDTKDVRVIKDINNRIIYNIQFKTINNKRLPVKLNNQEFNYTIYLKYI